MGYPDTLPDTWAATDNLGRAVANFEQAGPPQPNRTVGIFYFLWLGEVVGHKVHDISKLLAANPDDPQWGPEGAAHHWAEPAFGYYRSDDPWIIRRHAQMLTEAGVDVIVCDITNAVIYPEVVLKIGEVYTQMRAEGCRTPQIAFLLRTSTTATCRKIYDLLYGPGLYPDLWFRWQGKPLMLATPAEVPEDLRPFFTLRESWAFSSIADWFGDGRNKWQWIDISPQAYGWHDHPDRPEQMPVSVAAHATGNTGRSHRQRTQPPPEAQDPGRGIYFDEQIQRALEVMPEFLFVTGWNEWIAGRFISKPGGTDPFLGRLLEPGESYWVDQYNQEYSRDAEPQKGYFEDNYYYQLVDAIRRYKGVRPPPRPSAPTEIGGFDDWATVAPEYLDDPFDAPPRDFPGCGDAGVYKNDFGRNDFVRAKVARGRESVWFYVETREGLTPATDPDWMQLLLNSDARADTGWFGYDYVVNRQPGDGNNAVLERYDAGQKAWVEPVRVPMRAEGTRLMLAIPRAAVPAFAGRLHFQFKWADNVSLERMESPAGFMHGGDVAPSARFNYVYAEE